MNVTKDPDGLGALLRQTMLARQADAPGADRLLPGVRGRLARRSRARRRAAAVAVGAAAAVTALAVSATLLVGGGQRGGVSPASMAAGPSTPPHDQVVNGMRAWSFHGLQVRVPQRWPVNDLGCGEPMKATVVIDPGAIPMCALTPPPVVDFVRLSPATGVMPPSHHPVTVGGQRGTLGSERLRNGMTRDVLVLPGLDASVEAETRNPALAAAVIASAQVVTADVNGCRSRVASLHPAGHPGRPGAAGRLVPGHPAEASICHYTGNQLGHSTLVSGGRLHLLVTQLNALRPGLKSLGGMLGSECTQMDQEGYILRFFYAAGPPLDVFVHLYSCDHLGADSGARTGGFTDAFASTFSAQIDPGFNFPAAAGVH